MNDDQQAAEAIDPDEIGDDPSGDLSFPPDHAVGVTDRGQDDQVTDSYDERSRRGERDRPTSEDPDRIGRLLAVGDVLDDDEASMVADASEDDDPDDLSAEEAAMHSTRAPRYR